MTKKEIIDYLYLKSEEKNANVLDLRIRRLADSQELVDFIELLDELGLIIELN